MLSSIDDWVKFKEILTRFEVKSDDLTQPGRACLKDVPPSLLDIRLAMILHVCTWKIVGTCTVWEKRLESFYSWTTLYLLHFGGVHNVPFLLRAHTHALLKLDLSLQINIRRQSPLGSKLPLGFCPIMSTPDGNCLYNSVSTALFGSEAHSVELHYPSCCVSLWPLCWNGLY